MPADETRCQKCRREKAALGTRVRQLEAEVAAARAEAAALQIAIDRRSFDWLERRLRDNGVEITDDSALDIDLDAENDTEPDTEIP